MVEIQIQPQFDFLLPLRQPSRWHSLSLGGIAETKVGTAPVMFTSMCDGTAPSLDKATNPEAILGLGKSLDCMLRIMNEDLPTLHLGIPSLCPVLFSSLLPHIFFSWLNRAHVMLLTQISRLDMPVNDKLRLEFGESLELSIDELKQQVRRDSFCSVCVSGPADRETAWKVGAHLVFPVTTT